MSLIHNIIKIRRGTAAEWTASSPQPGGEVLRLGEPGYEKDTGRLKIGDGITPWNSLTYFNDGAPIDPETIQDILGSGFLVAGTGINIAYNDGADSLTISTSGVAFLNSPNFSGNPTVPTAPSGTNTTQIASTAFVRTEVSNLVDSAPILLDTLNELAAALGDDANFATTIASGLAQKAPLAHNHTSSDITNFNSSVSGLLPNVTGTGYVSSSFSNNTYTISVTGLQPSGNYSVVGHTHTSSNITDFNTAVSGLIPVKNIMAGTGIGVSSSSGIYTINSSNTVAADTLEPDGFVNRTDSTISFNDGSRQFSIAPKSPATSYAIYNNGVKVIKNTTEITTLPDTTALYYIHFDKSTNNLSYKTTGFNFDTDIPIAQVYYNADDNKAVYFGEERHGIRMDASTHRYLHNVFGTQYINGLSISNYSTSGNGSSNSDATIAIGDGLIYDEDIEANITHSNTPNNPFEQILNPIAQIPVYYKVGNNGAWTNTTANNYPVKIGTTVQYNLNSAGTWSASDSTNPTNNRYIAYWICATTQENAPIISIMGQRIDSSIEQATSNNSWGDLNLTGLPIVELRPLYRLIYDTKSAFSNTPKGFLVDVLDIRSHIDTVTGLTQNDHGNLYGLADDDHYQYVHIDNARTIDAVHTFTNGLNASGLINAERGNFSSLLNVNGSGYFASGIIAGSPSIIGNSGIGQYIDVSDGLIFMRQGFGDILLSCEESILFGDNQAPSVQWGSRILSDTSGNSVLYWGEQEKIGIHNSAPRYTLDVNGSGNFASGLYVNNIVVSVSGHTHTTSDITNFSSSVSGLLPTISNSGNNRILTSTGSSVGINAENRLTFDGVLLNVSGVGIFGEDPYYVGIGFDNMGSELGISKLDRTGGPYSHLNNKYIACHLPYDDSFRYGGNSLNPAIVISSGVNVGIKTFNPVYTLDVNGSGNFSSGLYLNNTSVSVSGHTHTSSNITDFSEAVQDVIGANGFLISGTGININYNDGANTLTISTSGLQPSGNYSTVGHTHTSSNITDFNSSVSGIINNSLSTDIIAGTGIALTYDNLNDDLIISSDGLVSVINLGAVSGTYPINAGVYNSIQTLSLNGTAVNFTKGSDWPLNSTSSTDTVLKMSVSVPTTITWTLVTQWFNQASSPLSSGNHLFLLRGIGTSTVEGHYIGNQTSP